MVLFWHIYHIYKLNILFFSFLEKRIHSTPINNMNNIQENKLSMYLVVDSVCDKYSAVWSSLAPFKAAFELFNESCEKIQELAREQENSSASVTKEKAQCRFKGADLANQIASVLKAHASVMSDLALAGKVDYTRSDFIRVRDVRCVELMQIVHDTAVSKASDLESYGIDADKIGELATEIARYRDLLAAPQEAIAARKVATEEMVAVFGSADKILNERLDNLIVLFKASSPEFVSEYQNARNIIDRNNPRPEPEEEAEAQGADAGSLAQ